MQGPGLFRQRVEAVSGGRVKVDGRWMLSFVSPNYLGLAAHSTVRRAIAAAAGRWGTSLAMPRIIGTDVLTFRLEAAIAALTGQEAALLFPSTTQVVLDALPFLAGKGGALYVDEWAYPTSLQGAHAAIVEGRAHIYRFHHDDPVDLERLLVTHGDRARGVIVCDGVYVDSGAPASLGRLLRVARRRGAEVYVDDAHGIGLLGQGPTAARPYGRGGAGTPAYLGVTGDRIVHAGSLAKAIGVPVAFVAGKDHVIDGLRASSSSLVHNSPPSIPIVAAGLASLAVNDAVGDRLRERLAERVSSFRKGVQLAGLSLGSTKLFPIQSLRFTSQRAAATAAQALWRSGIWALLQLSTREHPKLSALRFVISALHSQEDVEEAVAAIRAICRVGLASHSPAVAVLIDPQKGVLTSA